MIDKNRHWLGALHQYKNEGTEMGSSKVNRDDSELSRVDICLHGEFKYVVNLLEQIRVLQEI